MNTKKLIQANICLYLEEVFLHIGENGAVNVHINQVFENKNPREDIPRQSFAFFTLCKVWYFLPNSVNETLLHSVFTFIKVAYKDNEKLTALEKKFIELYIIRGCIFWRKEKVFFEDFLITNTISVVYTDPIAVHLFLETEADSVVYLNQNLMPERYVDVAKEAVVYSLKSEQKDNYKSYMYTDIFYYHDVLRFSIQKETVDFVNRKMKEEIKTLDIINTSVIASMFEGFTSLPFGFEKEQNFLFGECLNRKIIRNPYLENMFNYTESSLAEIANTSYVCLDTYCHLILGLLNKFNNTKYVK